MNVVVKDFDPDLILYFNNIRPESFKCLKSFEYCLIFIESHCVFFIQNTKSSWIQDKNQYLRLRSLWQKLFLQMVPS